MSSDRKGHARRRDPASRNGPCSGVGGRHSRQRRHPLALAPRHLLVAISLLRSPMRIIYWGSFFVEGAVHEALSYVKVHDVTCQSHYSPCGHCSALEFSLISTIAGSKGRCPLRSTLSSQPPSQPFTRNIIHLMLPVHQIFPIEVFESIIDEASDHHRSLRNISLACRTFLPRARHHLFYRIVIKSQEQMFSIPAFLRERPWLLPLVRVVRLFPHQRCPTKLRYPYGLLEAVPVSLLTQLPSVRRFELQVDHHHTSQRLSPKRLTLSALRVYSAATKHLELTRVEFLCIDDLMRYLSAFPNLSYLVYQYVQYRSNGVPPNSLSVGVMSRYTLKLTHLVVSTNSPVHGMHHS